MRRGAPAAPPPPKPTHQLVPGVYVVDKPDVNQGRVSMGHLSAMRSSPDYHALQVMNLILLGHIYIAYLTMRRLAGLTTKDNLLLLIAGISYAFSGMIETGGVFLKKNLVP